MTATKNDTPYKWERGTDINGSIVYRYVKNPDIDIPSNQFPPAIHSISFWYMSDDVFGITITSPEALSDDFVTNISNTPTESHLVTNPSVNNMANGYNMGVTVSNGNLSSISIARDKHRVVNTVLDQVNSLVPVSDEIRQEIISTVAPYHIPSLRALIAETMERNSGFYSETLHNQHDGILTEFIEYRDNYFPNSVLGNRAAAILEEREKAATQNIKSSLPSM